MEYCARTKVLITIIYLITTTKLRKLSVSKSAYKSSTCIIFEPEKLPY